MLKCRLPVEIVDVILHFVGRIGYPSLRNAFQALDTFDPKLIRVLLETNREEAVQDILETGDLQSVRCIFANGVKLNKAQYAGLFKPYRSDVLKLVWENGYSCLTKRAKMSWWDFVDVLSKEDDMLDLLSFHTKLREAPITKDAAKTLVERRFARVIQHLFVNNYNVPWLRYSVILHPQQCADATTSWELFQKLFLTGAKQYVRGYRLDNCQLADMTTALRVILSRITAARQLMDCERQLGPLAREVGVGTLLREAKIRLGFPAKQLRLPGSLDAELAEQLHGELLNEAIKSKAFHTVKRTALLQFVERQSWSVVKNLLFHVSGVWEKLLDLMCSDELSSITALASEVLPVAGPNRPLSLRQATLLLRKGQWRYLAAHSVWSRSVTLTYVAVGLGLQDFVGLSLKRMAPPFDVAGAIEMARERGQLEMAAYLAERRFRS